MARLIIAEKPSVARDIARVLKVKTRGAGHFRGSKVWISWCIGHVAELCEPAEYNPAWKSWSASTLPMLPEQFKVKPAKSSLNHWGDLKTLLRSPEVEEVINACDAGREGELIFRYAYELAGCQKPVRRLWLSSMTDQAIQQAFMSLRPGKDFDALADAARCRSEADWLVGLNATRALTLLGRRHGHSELLSVGRVQTPTLAMIVEREREIESFVPEPFFQIYARFKVAEGDYEGQWAKDGDNRLKTRQEAEAIAQAVDGQIGKVTKVQQKKVKERPPLLFDLTQLQRAANQRYGLSAAATLAAAQALYETHKLLTYPRTDSNYLTTDMIPTLPGRLQGIAVPPYKPFCDRLLAAQPLPSHSRIVNDKEVGDHHAIIPTGRKPELERLNAAERQIFDLAARRFIAVFFPDAVFATTLIETVVLDHRFVTRGRVRLEAGWQEVEPPASQPRRPAQAAPRPQDDDDEDEDSPSGKPSRRPPKEPEQELPNARRGEAAEVLASRVHEGLTKPPRRFNESTLLGAMERAGNDLEEDELRRAMKESGLGTPATRASIIETLLKRDYIERSGKNLVPKPRGRTLIGAMPVEDLKSAALTGTWEARMSQVADGRLSRADFMSEARKFTALIVPQILAVQPGAATADSDAVDFGDSDAEILGPCPLCGKPVTESFKVYGCQSGRQCDFVIFKTVAGRKINPKLVKVLLAVRRSKRLKGFKSKAGKPFEASLVLDDLGKIAFDFSNDDPAAARSSSPPAPAAHTSSPPASAAARTSSSPVPTPSRASSTLSHISPQHNTSNHSNHSTRTPAAARREVPLDRDAPPPDLDDRNAPPPPDAFRDPLPHDAHTAPATSPPAQARREPPAAKAPAAHPSPAQEPPTQAAQDTQEIPAHPCPSCAQGHVIRGRKGWGCSRWREGCRFVVWYEQHGRALPDDEADRLFKAGRTRLINGLLDPHGNKVRARLLLDLHAEGFVRLDIPNAPPTSSPAS